MRAQQSAAPVRGIECDRWNWCRIVASEHGPASSTTRHVLLTLALHMNEHGQGAWPSQKKLATESGLSERTVREHLALAEAQSWIAVHQRRRPQQAWFVHEYVATIPAELESLVKVAPWETDPTWQRPAGDSARSGERPAGAAGRSGQRAAGDSARSGQRAANDAQRPAGDSGTGGSSPHNARQELPPNYSYNYSINYPKERAASSTRVALQKGKRDDQERKHMPFPQTQPTQEGLHGRAIKDALRKPLDVRALSDVELGERVEKLWNANIEPELIVATLRNCADAERIRQVLSHRFNVPWVST